MSVSGGFSLNEDQHPGILRMIKIWIWDALETLVMDSTRNEDLRAHPAMTATTLS